MAVFATAEARPARTTPATVLAPSTPAPSATPEQTALPASSVTSKTRGDDVLLQFEAFLQSEAKEYRDSLEGILRHLEWIIGILGGLAVAVFAGLGYKSAKDIRAQVNARFRTSIDALVDQRVEELDTLIKSNRKRVEEIFAETNLLVGKISNFTAAWTYAFSLLEQPSKEQRYELARRDAKRQLEAVRGDFPHWRHLGIMLARLHAHFEDYEGAVKVLTDVINEREKRHLPHGIDYAALLYSRACYQNRWAEKLEREDEEHAEQLRTAAWSDLNSSIKSDPENLKEAIGDDDLKTLWNNANRKRDSLKADD